MPHDADDKLVWSLPSGSTLACSQDLVVEDSREICFTQGRKYRVESMHPIADPPFVKLTNDHGQSHRLEACDLRQFFGR